MADSPAALAKSEALAELRARAFLMLDAFERDQPGSGVGQLRQVIESASSLGAMQTILRELRAGASTLSAAGRQHLDHELSARFGPRLIAEQEREQAVVATVRRRGSIRSEREYRIVQAYADAMSGDPGAEAGFLALGALLDEFSAAAKLPNDR